MCARKRILLTMLARPASAAASPHSRRKVAARTLPPRPASASATSTLNTSSQLRVRPKPLQLRSPPQLRPAPQLPLNVRQWSSYAPNREPRSPTKYKPYIESAWLDEAWRGAWSGSLVSVQPYRRAPVSRATPTKIIAEHLPICFRRGFAKPIPPRPWLPDDFVDAAPAQSETIAVGWSEVLDDGGSASPLDGEAPDDGADGAAQQLLQGIYDGKRAELAAAAKAESEWWVWYQEEKIKAAERARVEAEEARVAAIREEERREREMRMRREREAKEAEARAVRLKEERERLEKIEQQRKKDLAKAKAEADAAAAEAAKAKAREKRAAK